MWRSVLVIWPKYFSAVDKDNLHGGHVAIFEEVIQLILGISVVIGLAWSYMPWGRYRLESIKILLFIQSI